MTKSATAVIQELPTNLKELIALAKENGINYTFQKKPELVKLIEEALAKKNGSAAPAKAEPKKAVKVSEDGEAKKPVKEVKPTKGAAVEMPTEEEESDGDGEETEETKPAKKAAKKNDKEDVKTSKKKEEPKAEPKKSDKKEESAKPKFGKAPMVDIKVTKARQDVKDVLNGKNPDKTPYTKSDKIRKLFSKCELTIGEVAKVMDVHYSFAYCVIDAHRKMIEPAAKDGKKA